MTTPTRRPLLVAMVTAFLVLLGLAVLVDSPVADAMPNLFASAVLLVFATVLLRQFSSDRLLVAIGLAFVVGALGAGVEGLATLDVMPAVPLLTLVGDVALVVAIIAFLLWRQ